MSAFSNAGLLWHTAAATARSTPRIATVCHVCLCITSCLLNCCLLMWEHIGPAIPFTGQLALSLQNSLPGRFSLAGNPRPTQGGPLQSPTVQQQGDMRYHAAP